MLAGHQALTDKEKQTLRLLVEGYDAKSMARRLGLSVHTVNERLRDARRKLAVSSSREAARLLREAERVDPQSLGDDVLGAASAPAWVDSPADRTGNRGAVRRSGWIAGGIAMSFGLAMLAYAALSGAAETTAPAPATAQTEAAPVTAAKQWLALVDAGDWQSSWQATAQSFRAVNTVANWQSASQSARVPLGAVRSRVVQSAIDVPTPPNGNHVVRFATSFAGKAEAVETVALVREDGNWKVVGYYID